MTANRKPLDVRHEDASKEHCKHCDRTIFLPPTFASNPGKTHWEECWRSHHGCAIVVAERLLKQNSALKSALEETIIPMIRLGDFIGNEDKGGMSGLGAFDRCAIISKARAALKATEDK